MTTPNRKYPELSGAVTPDVPYGVNAALRSVDKDVQAQVIRLGRLETAAGWGKGDLADDTVAALVGTPNTETHKEVEGLVDVSVQPLVAKAIAQDGTIAAAAAAGVSTAVKNLDIVHGDDERIMRETESDIYGIPFTDGDGYVAAGVTVDGLWNTEKPPMVQGTTGVTFQPVDAPGWAELHVDRDGYVSYGIKTDGTFVSYKSETRANDANMALGLSRSKRDALAVAGDSLSYGYFDGSPGPMNESWPAKLQELLGAKVVVSNLAASGFTVDEEAVRVGALKLPLSAAGGKIPASGPVKVTVGVNVGWRGTATVRNFTGTLAGVPGTLSRLVDDTFQFTRTTSGTEKALPDDTKFIPEFESHSADTLVIMLGRNNVSFQAKGDSETIEEHVVQGIRRLVDWHSRDLAQVLVVSVITTTNELAGTTGYARVVEINRRLHLEYGPKFFDLRRYLVNQAIHDLGITPTAEDKAKMAGDTLPPSIMDPLQDSDPGTWDSTHYSRATAALVAAQMHDYLTTREWMKN